jgi:Rrf2 family protein
MFSQTVEYSLRAVVTLAQNKGQACTAQQISELTQVPGPYLSKVMQVLVRSGLVHSQRGLHGGFVLAKEPGDINILDVVDAVEPFKRIRACPLGLDTHDELCPLHRCLDQGMALAEQAYRNTTITELLNEPESVTPLCEIPKVQLEPASDEAPAAKPSGAKETGGPEGDASGSDAN